MTSPVYNAKARPLNGELTIIQLKVKKPGKLFNANSESDFDEEDDLLEECCELSDNFNSNSLSQGNSNDLKDFSSFVWSNSVIVWIGKLRKKHREKGYSISVDAIEITSPGNQSEFFRGKLRSGSGQGIVVWSKEVINLLSDQKYAIYFTLYKGDTSKQFKIDPRLKGNPGSSVSYLLTLRNCLAPPPTDLTDMEVKLIQPIVKQVDQLKASVEEVLAELKK